jgi:hypothetical protein
VQSKERIKTVEKVHWYLLVDLYSLVGGSDGVEAAPALHIMKTQVGLPVSVSRQFDAR